ncbi:UNVERIFIED_CONTAM: putative aspartic proteinase GIP2 [Sesamum calycinum]|uniref:Aspartic proteinase GIP2 n=1 Tax=Sesamum calycinum TaxID=2727403 RepID=A0AAW2R9F9_9LAMI
MASSRCAILFFLAILISASNAQNGLILPIRKDAKTYQFYTTVELGSNRAAITHHRPRRPIFLGVVVSEFFGVDTLYAKNQQPVPEYLFSCMESRFMEGLASGANGVGGETLSVKNSYFSIDKDGVGGTKISTIQNFTAVHNSIYKPLARAFTKAAADMKIRSVAAVEPFRACFSSDSISRTPAGPSVPTVDLVLPGNDIYWRISGANAVVEVNQRTTCLAFVDGGSNPRTSVVIGAHQLEDNFLEFDLVSSQLKFSSSLLVQNQSCSRL